MKHSCEHFFAPIGKVIFVFNQIETSLIFLAGGFCPSEHHAVTALMAEASFSRKLDALKCIGDDKIKDAALLSELTELLKQLQTAEDIRNRISHTTFTGSPETQLWKIKWGGKRKTGNTANLQYASIEEIEKAGELVSATFGKLCKFMQTLQERGVLKVRIVQ